MHLWINSLRSLRVAANSIMPQRSAKITNREKLLNGQELHSLYDPKDNVRPGKKTQVTREKGEAFSPSSSLTNLFPAGHPKLCFLW